MKEPHNSCGILLFNNNEEELKIFLVHPGGPYFADKDLGYWSVPKGIAEEGEDFLEAAKREFLEETSIEVTGEYIPLGSVQQNKRKTVHTWALKSDMKNPVEITSNRFDVEHPWGSGNYIDIPEVDEGKFFSVEEARVKINSAQSVFLDRLLEILSTYKG